MNNIATNIENKTVYPIIIKNKGNIYLTLYYELDSVLHNNTKHILYFQSTEDMEQFCEKNDLQAEPDIWYEYDFDAIIRNPIDYRQILMNWNLLNTIAKDFGMYFEGDCKKYDALYDLLFRLNTPIEPIPPTYMLSEKNYQYLLKVFRKKDRFLRLFDLQQN